MCYYFCGLTSVQHIDYLTILQICPTHFFKGFGPPVVFALSQKNLTSTTQSFLFFYSTHEPAQWWICNYWWLHISSELLQSASMVIVKEVICIKLIIRRNKAHKSGHYQFSRKCFKRTLLRRVQGKKGKDSLILPNQGSNLSERTKTWPIQWIHWGMGSILWERNEVFFSCVLLNHINGTIKKRCIWKLFTLLFGINDSSKSTYSTSSLPLADAKWCGKWSTFYRM